MLVLAACFAFKRRAFGSADDARHDLLLNWALKKGVGRDKGREDSSQGLYDDGCFTNHMNDIRRRLLNVLSMDRKKVEVSVLFFEGIRNKSQWPNIDTKVNRSFDRVKMGEWKQGELEEDIWVG